MDIYRDTFCIHRSEEMSGEDYEFCDFRDDYFTEYDDLVRDGFSDLEIHDYICSSLGGVFWLPKSFFDVTWIDGND